MLKIIGFILLFLFILSLVLFAQQAEKLKFSSSVDKTEISLGELLNFKVTVEGSFKGSPEIKLPKLRDDFDIVSQTQSHRISIEAGKKNRIFVLNLMLLAKREGQINIAAAELKQGSKVYTTEPMEITVKPGKGEKKFLREPEEEFPAEEEVERITL
ncbi:MAG: BatD family protein [Candidatus Omnitrophica bacterium]|nr:BatD family protein [Candidatus Omnitrophota bacterium]